MPYAHLRRHQREQQNTFLVLLYKRPLKVGIIPYCQNKHRASQARWLPPFSGDTTSFFETLMTMYAASDNNKPGEPPVTRPASVPDDQSTRSPLPEPPYQPYSNKVPTAPYEPYKGI